MSRVSTNQYDTRGNLANGFDYEAQLWVKDGIVQPCGHPESMRNGPSYCCRANRYAGKGIVAVLDVIRAAAAAE